jgi:hypothetical protein
LYEEQKKVGDKTDEQMAKLVHQAIDKALKCRDTEEIRGTTLDSRKL